MSDSLKEIVIVIVSVLTISANGELELLEEEDEDEEPPDPPRLPAVVVPPARPPRPEVDEELDDELLLAALFDVEPPDTESPATSPDSDAIVPPIGAYSFVSSSADCALRTFVSAANTDASAEAMLAGDGVVVVAVEPEWELEELEPPEPLPRLPDPLAPLDPLDPLPELLEEPPEPLDPLEDDEDGLV
jgi:hypothetical protein